MRRALLICALCLLPAASAHAAFFPGTSVDADVAGAPDVALARDGGGAMAYAKAEGVYASVLTLGAPGPPARIDGSQPGGSSSVHVGVANGGRVLVTWVNGGTLYAALRPAAAAGFSAPVPVLGDASGAVALSMTINGKAYAAAVTSSGDLREAYMGVAGTWSVADAPLDVDAARTAGSPAVAASGDGSALFAWAETGGDGVSHVFARRAVRSRLSAAPREVSLGAFEGRPGGAADSPSVGIEYDSSYAWIAFRQTFSDGGSLVWRALARRLLGSEFDPPVAIDGLAFGTGAGAGADQPRLAFTGRGRGTFAARVLPDGVAATLIKNDVLGATTRLDAGPSAGVALPAPTAVDDSTGTVVWLRDLGAGPAALVGRRFDAKAADPEASLLEPSLGAPDPAGAVASADRSGNAAVAFGQGGHVVLSVFDRPPRAPAAHNDERWRAESRPKLHWATVVDTWTPGSVQYRLEIDHVAQATLTSTTWRAPRRLPDGDHRWRIVTSDARGQETVGIDRFLRIDTVRPVVRLRAPSRARSGAVVRITLTASDATSGVRRVLMDFGDGPPVKARVDGSGVARLRHRYGAARRYTLRATVGDQAGNEVIATRHLTVK